MLIPTIFFILGFALLIKGADFLVDGSSSIAKRYGISNIVIGLTIVAFGTSFPELVVSALASFEGSNGIAFGNIIGSNISNTLLILGVSAAIRSMQIKKATVKKEIPLSLLAILAVFFLSNDSFIDGTASSFLSRGDGLVLLLFFSIFIYYTFGIAKERDGILDNVGDNKIKTRKTFVSFLMIVLGLTGMFLGGKWIVDGAVLLASSFGVSEMLIGLTIVAIGTSLPELAASGMAAYKGKSDIAIGAVVGSNIFNLLWVLGVSSLIHPIPYSFALNQDFLVLFAITILLLFLIYYKKKNILNRREGVILLILYFFYIIMTIVRG